MISPLNLNLALVAWSNNMMLGNSVVLAPMYSPNLLNNPNPSLDLEKENFNLSLYPPATLAKASNAEAPASVSSVNRNMALFFYWNITLIALSLNGNKVGAELVFKNVSSVAAVMAPT